MEFVLLAVFSFTLSNGLASQAILFPTQAGCENAKTRVLEEFGPMTKAICLPRYSAPGVVR